MSELAIRASLNSRLDMIFQIELANGDQEWVAGLCSIGGSTREEERSLAVIEIG